MHFKKVVNKEFLFFPRLRISASFGRKEKNLTFDTLIDLKFEHGARARRFSMPYSETNPFGDISFGNYFTVEELSRELAEQMKNSQLFDGFAGWQLGTTMGEARSFVPQVLPLLLESIALLEGRFHFPAPLDKLTVDEMYARRLKAREAYRPGRPSLPDGTDLWHGLSLHCGESTAHMMISYCRKTGDLEMIPKLKEFISAIKAEPIGPQIVQLKD